MEGAVGAEFQDWEVLLDDSFAETGAQFSRQKSIRFGGIEGEFDSDTVIKSDYFSLDNQGRLPKSVPEPNVNQDEEGSVESDNPGWIDPSSESRHGPVIKGELWSDSGSDRSDERKFSEVDSKTELGIVEFVQGDDGLSGGIQKLERLESHESKISGSDPKFELRFEEFDEIRSQTKDISSGRSDERKFSEFDSKTESGIVKFVQGDDEVSGGIQKLESKLELGFEEFDEIESQTKDLNNFCSDYGGDIDQSGSNVVKLEEEEKKEHLEENKNLQIEETKVNSESGNEVVDKRKVVWWKVPFEVFRYCLFKASPVWSFSVAAAVMGFIILGRKLYKMKRKAQSLHLKVILDEKKGSQSMNRAARLNEAFSVVRRVPIVRPALPASGINPWPAMSMS